MLRSFITAATRATESSMLPAVFFVVLVAGTNALPGGFRAEDDSGVEDANAYVDSVIEFEMPRRMATLDPLLSRNFQPINGNHRDISVRFLSTNVTGLRQIRRDGDCQLTRAVDEHPTTLRCNLLTDLHYEVVVNFRYNNMTIRNLRVNGTFYDVKGPLTVTLKRSLPVKLDFSPRFDAMVNSLARRYPRPKWYDLMEKEFYLTMIHLFEFATQKAFATEMFRAAKDVPFPE